MSYWRVPYKLHRGGWGDRYDTISMTRTHAIGLWCDEMQRRWRVWRRKGEVRCVKVKIVPVKGR